MSKFRAWLRLIRVAALPTALADVWLGIAVADLIRTWHVVWLSLVSLALYAAGMILNDVHDVRDDARDNPRRPLPSGQISVASARAVGFALLAAAVGGAAILSARAAAVAGVLALLILSYNFLLKATPLGPLNMGLCRACNVILGISAVPLVFGHKILAGLPVAAPIFLYVTAVTYLARLETQSPKRTLIVPPLLGMVLAIAHVPVLFFLEAARSFPVFDWADVLSGRIGIAVLALTLCAILLLVWAVWKARDVRRAVAAALVGIIPLQALVACAHLRLIVAGCIILLLLPVIGLRKQSHIT